MYTVEHTLSLIDFIDWLLVKQGDAMNQENKGKRKNLSPSIGTNLQEGARDQEFAYVGFLE